MRKLFALLLVFMFVLTAGSFAEDIQISETEYQGDYFTITLPAGIEPLEDPKPFTEGALQNYTGVVPCLLASDVPGIRLLCVTVIDSEMNAHEAAVLSAQTLLGSSDTVCDTAFGKNQCSEFSCAVDSVKYDYIYLADGQRVFCIICAGLTDDEKELAAASFVFSQS